MNKPGPSLWLAKPELSDEAAAQLLDFLYEITTAFENAYFAQLHRYYANPQPEDNNLRPPEPLDSNEDPF